MPTLDQEERSENQNSVIIPIGGLVISFDSQFHNVPFVELTAISATATTANAADVTTTGFTARVFDSSGVDIGGTINWRGTGV